MTEVVSEATAGTVVGPTAIEKVGRFADYMAGRAKIESDEGSSEEVAAQIAMRTLEAKTEEEAWEADQGGMPGGRDLVDVELRVFGIDYAKSKRDDINSMFGNTYLLVNAMRLSNGEEITFNTSSAGLVAKLVRFESLGLFDKDSDPKGLGYRDAVIKNVGTELRPILTLRPVSARAI